MEDINMEGSLVLRSTVSYRSSRLVALQIAEVEPNSWGNPGKIFGLQQILTEPGPAH